MSKVYIITKGEYSDFKIVTIVSRAESAEAICKNINGHEEAEAEYAEWEIDGGEWCKGLLPYYLYMSRDGTSGSYMDDDELMGLRLDPLRKGGFMLRGKVWARDEKHAAKIANEKRAQLIAENQWPPDGEG